jgi:hypothetical protein
MPDQVLQVCAITHVLCVSEAGPPIVTAAVKSNNVKVENGENEKVTYFFLFYKHLALQIFSKYLKYSQVIVVHHFMYQ